VPVARLRHYIEQIPRLRARHEYAVLPARQLASGLLSKASAREVLADLRSTAEGRSFVRGAEAFALIRRLNARARSEGRLYEQLHPPQVEAVRT